MNKDRPKRANVKRPSTKNPQSKIEHELVAEDLSFASLSAPKTKLPGLVETNDEEKPTQAKPTPDVAPKEAVVPTTVESKPKISPPSLSKAAAPVEQPKISLNILENVKLRKTIRVKSPIPGGSSEETTSTTPAPTIEPKVTSTSVPGALSAPIPPANITTPVTTNSSAPNKLGNRFSMFEQSSNTTTPLFPGLKPTPFKKAAELNTNTSSDLTELKEEEGSGTSESASATATPTNSTTVVGSSQSVPTTKPNKPLPPVPPFKPPRPPFNPSTGKSSSLSSDQPPLQTQQLFAKLRPVSVMGSASESSSVCSSGANTNNDSTNTCLAKANNVNTNIKNISPTKLTNPILNENENLAGSSSTTPTPATESNGKSTSSSSSELKINTDKEKRTSVRDIVQMLSEESKVRTV